MIAELSTLKLGTYYYSDIPASFAKSVVNNDLSASYDLKAVQESLAGIIQTNKGERPFEPEFGCDVNKQLFQNISVAAANNIKYEIENSVSNFEPRVILTGVVVSPVYESNRYDVSIYYHLRTDLESTYATSLQLNRGLNG